MESCIDYEIITEIGYKTSEGEETNIIELNINKKGNHSFHFLSDQKPVFIQLDPNHRVPQTDINDDSWTNEKEMIF